MTVPLRTLLGTLLGLLVRLWAWTWRVQCYQDFVAARGRRERVVWAFWHGHQMAIVGAPRRAGTGVLVSWSRDGEIQAAALRRLGLRVHRGSSSRGGAAGLRRLLRALEGGEDIAVAVDGPRGPRHRAKAGAARAAARARAHLVPVGAAAAPAVRLRGVWDHFMVPLPFARVVVQTGAAVEPSNAMARPVVLERAIASASALARARLYRGAAQPMRVKT